jgi:actin-related protein
MDVSSVRSTLESFDEAQKSIERQREEEKAIAKKEEEKKEAERARKKKEEQYQSISFDKSALLGKSIGLGEAIAMSIIASVIG